MADVIFDRKEQLQKIQRLLVPNETLYAVYDLKGGGTGFVGITDLRLIFMDSSPRAGRRRFCAARKPWSACLSAGSRP